MANDFLYPDTKTPNPELDEPTAKAENPEQPIPVESKLTQGNKAVEAGLEAARNILKIRPNPEGLQAEMAMPTTNEQFVENLGEVISGDPERVKAVLDASQQEIHLISSKIRKDEPLHQYEGDDPHKIIEALGAASEEDLDHRQAA